MKEAKTPILFGGNPSHGRTKTHESRSYYRVCSRQNDPTDPTAGHGKGARTSDISGTSETSAGAGGAFFFSSRKRLPHGAGSLWRRRLSGALPGDPEPIVAGGG